jgi:hypothetical protein
VKYFEKLCKVQSTRECVRKFTNHRFGLLLGEKTLGWANDPESFDHKEALNYLNTNELALLADIIIDAKTKVGTL